MHKVIDDPTKISKIILENEQREGLGAKMDKKSLDRLLDKLAAEGQLKNIYIELRHEKTLRVKTLRFVCEPDIDETHTVIQSAVEQAKMKFNILPRHSAAIAAYEEDLEITKEFAHGSIGV